MLDAIVSNKIAIESLTSRYSDVEQNIYTLNNNLWSEIKRINEQQKQIEGYLLQIIKTNSSIDKRLSILEDKIQF